MTRFEQFKPGIDFVACADLSFDNVVKVLDFLEDGGFIEKEWRVSSSKKPYPVYTRNCTIKQFLVLLKPEYSLCGFLTQEWLCDFPVEESNQRSHKEGGNNCPYIHFSKDIDAADAAKQRSQGDADQIADDPAILEWNPVLLL